MSGRAVTPAVLQWGWGWSSRFFLASSQEVKIDKNLEPGLRVTVRLNQNQLPGILECAQPSQPAGSEPPPSDSLVPSPHLHSLSASSPESKTYRGKVVSSQDPRTKAGLYWGYTVRLASCLSKHRASSYEHLFSSLCLGDLRELQTGILILLTCCVSLGRCLSLSWPRVHCLGSF